MKKPHPDLVITRGSHLSKCVNSHTGEVKLIWDWDKLLEEVKIATQSIVAVTEAKVKKTRKPREKKVKNEA